MNDSANKKNYHNRIADLANDDKPREKALKNGIRALSDTELIAILLGGGIPGKSVIDLSKEMYHAYGDSLTTMARQSIRDITRSFNGIGPAKAVTLAAAFELGARRQAEHITKQAIRGADDAYQAIRDKIENLPVEEFWILILSRSNNIIATEHISIGGTAATLVDVKVIAKRAIEHMASSIILAHNHPSGNLQPSSADDALTEKVRKACSLIDVVVLDHIIVGPNGFYSYADTGRI